MRRSEFQFELPPELIAQRPSAERGGSRLMTVHHDGAPTISSFSAIIDAFRGDEVLVLNDTKVVPARVFGKKSTGGAVEVFIIEPLGDNRVLAMVRGKRLKPGTQLILPGAQAQLKERRGDGTVELYLKTPSDLWTWLDAVGQVPLPPYIERTPDAEDATRYQTVFAENPGAVAAPTAGLHLTDPVLDALRQKGVLIKTLTLHVGPGTFRPVKTDDVSDHQMHSERFTVPAETAEAIRSGRPVIGVGTTVVRALEAHARDTSVDRTDLFILPGFEFQIIDGLLTNFHLPESTLLMLVCAFAGKERVLNAYQAAVAAGLRFYSYGDAMMLRREDGRWI